MSQPTDRATPGVLRRGLRAGMEFVDALLPAGCAICSAAVPGHRSPVCALCESRLHPVPPPWCPKCGITRLLDIGVADGCPECETWPPRFRAASACLHEGVAAELVRGMKYRGYTALAPILAARMVGSARRLLQLQTPLLAPVPLAPSRRRERGFNQAALLAGELGSYTGWPTADLLRRPTGGPSLARKGRHDRGKLACAAYVVDRAAMRRADRMDGVLIVDDVITTGATVSACAAALSEAGATCIGAVSFTRAAAALEHA